MSRKGTYDQVSASFLWLVMSACFLLHYLSFSCCFLSPRLSQLSSKHQPTPLHSDQRHPILSPFSVAQFAQLLQHCKVYRQTGVLAQTSSTFQLKLKCANGQLSSGLGTVVDKVCTPVLYQPWVDGSIALFMVSNLSYPPLIEKVTLKRNIGVLPHVNFPAINGSIWT